MNLMKRSIHILALMCITSAWSLANSGPVLWGGLDPGRFDVGFTVVHLLDTSRPFGRSAARPIQVSLWYPVVRDPARARSRMPFSEYVVLNVGAVTDNDRQISTSQRSKLMQQYWKEAFPKAQESSVEHLLAVPTFALRDAKPANGRFPLIVYVPGYGGTPLTHTPTAEYLASHGYVVAISPSQGMTFDTAGEEEQVRDIEFIASSLSTRPMVDPSRRALMGYSFGGGSVIVASMRDSHIAAVVSLDGMALWDHTADIVRNHPAYDPAAFRAPLLALKSDNDYTEDLSILKSLVLSDRQLLHIKGAQHHNYIASSIINSVVNGNPNDEAQRIYRVVVLRLRGFLDHQLHSDGLQSYAQEEPDIDNAGLVSEIVFPPVAAPSHDELIVLGEEGEVDKLVGIQHEFSRHAPGIPLLTSGALHMLGLRFLDKGQRDKAVQLFEFLVELYPRDSLAFNRLGDLYRDRKDFARATRCYEQSLTVKPGNGGATKGLETLKRLQAESVSSR
jgi:hypothetical protein